MTVLKSGKVPNRLLGVVGILACSLSLVRAAEPLLTLGDVQQVVAQSASYAKTYSPKSLIAVVNREGFLLALWSANSTIPTQAQIAAAVSKALTGAYLSSNEQAFTSRTAGFIVQQNFPPGVNNTPPGPLVGIGNSNLYFSDLNFAKGPGSPQIPYGMAVYTRVTGSSLSGSVGGVPLYKGGKLVGAIGVVSDKPEGFTLADNVNESVALAGQKNFEPAAFIFGSNVFINGLRLPYVISVVKPFTVLAYGAVGSAVPGYPVIASAGPLPYPTETIAGVVGELRAPFQGDPLPGTINGKARLNVSEVRAMVAACIQRTTRTRSGIRFPVPRPAQMVITVVNNPNQAGVAPAILANFRTPDCIFDANDVTPQKARTALFFSSNSKAMSSRAVGFLAQSLYPPGITGSRPGPFNGLQEAFSKFPPNPNLPNGITLFGGAFPLYRNGQLIGAISASGDGVEQDDLIGAEGAALFPPPQAIRADQFTYLGARLPYAKFPRDPDL
jgi:uncharacterized protein GlcG (DUF336 family)